MTTATSIAYLNGEFKPLDAVCISPLDRGFLFADGIYEMIPVYNGRCLRLSEHLQRLDNGLAALRLNVSLSHSAWEALLVELIERNGGGDLALYLQITRGAANSRDHGFPTSPCPTLFAMTSPLKPVTETLRRQGVTAVIAEDIRWGACHIKTIALLANVLARQQAVDRGASEAILVRDGYLTEGAANNLFLVSDAILYTPIKDQRILPGITRDLILELAAANDIPYREVDLPVTALETADEVWLTSSTKEILPVTMVEGHTISAGVPGPLWQRMMALYQDYKHAVCPPV